MTDEVAHLIMQFAKRDDETTNDEGFSLTVSFHQFAFETLYEKLPVGCRDVREILLLLI